MISFTKRLAWVAVFLLTQQNLVFAQELHISETPLVSGGLTNLNYNPEIPNEYLSYRFTIPFGSTAIIGVKRVNGEGDLDAVVSRDVKAGDLKLPKFVDVVAVSKNDEPRAELFTLHESGDFVLTLFTKDNQPADWEIRTSYFNHLNELAKAGFKSGATRVIECFFADCSDAGSQDSQRFAGRALGHGLNILQARSICSWSVGAFATETLAGLGDLSNLSPVLTYTATNYLTSFGSRVADATC